MAHFFAIFTLLHLGSTFFDRSFSLRINLIKSFWSRRSKTRSWDIMAAFSKIIGYYERYKSEI